MWRAALFQSSRERMWKTSMHVWTQYRRGLLAMSLCANAVNDSQMLNHIAFATIWYLLLLWVDIQNDIGGILNVKHFTIPNELVYSLASHNLITESVDQRGTFYTWLEDLFTSHNPVLHLMSISFLVCCTTGSLCVIRIIKSFSLSSFLGREYSVSSFLAVLFLKNTCFRLNGLKHPHCNLYIKRWQ